MISSQDKITTPQAIVVFVSYIMAAGILSLPRTAAAEAGTPDVWLSVIIGGLITRCGYDKIKPGLPRKDLF
ncbi:Spore germination protein YndE [Bacillus sonorensis]|uniref:Spore germination protein YndE n=1 Tax=Bacillus sonorensis TaxID=119858 RepID=A0ABM6LHZ7_9BACI|nr:Spore germination protein YndE [Bacillus sonorensis]